MRGASAGGVISIAKLKAGAGRSASDPCFDREEARSAAKRTDKYQSEPMNHSSDRALSLPNSFQ